MSVVKAAGRPKDIMTPDGIATGDWDRVTEISFDIVNAYAMDDDILVAHHKERVFELLDELETSYGRLPSILATRADYSDDFPLAIALHEEALEVAEDPLSVKFSLQSLVRLLIDEKRGESVIARRLEELDAVTNADPDAENWERDALEELRADFESLRRDRAKPE